MGGMREGHCGRGEKNERRQESVRGEKDNMRGGRERDNMRGGRERDNMRGERERQHERGKGETA